MNKTWAISSWIAFLISVDILWGALRLHEFHNRASARPAAQTAFITAWCLLPDGSSSLLLHQFVYARTLGLWRGVRPPSSVKNCVVGRRHTRHPSPRGEPPQATTPLRAAPSRCRRKRGQRWRQRYTSASQRPILSQRGFVCRRAPASRRHRARATRLPRRDRGVYSRRKFRHRAAAERQWRARRLKPIPWPLRG